MSERVTMKTLEGLVEIYANYFYKDGCKAVLFEGSKTNGRAFRLFWVDERGGQLSFPGTMHNGYLGMTGREAYDALSIMVRVIQDFHYEQQED